MHACTQVMTKVSLLLSRFSHARLFVTLWTVAYQAPLAMGFSRQEYWSALPCPPLGDLPDPGIELMALKSPTLAGVYLPLVPPGKLRELPRMYVCEGCSVMSNSLQPHGLYRKFSKPEYWSR